MTEIQLFAVTGNPILHSKSPDIFNPVFEKNARNARYFRLAAQSPAEALFLFKKTGLKGMNVTAPFKQTIMPLLHQISPAAAQIGSVNTIVNQNGRLKGYNTDFLGVLRSFSEKNIALKNKNCIVAGAGGAAKAVVYALAGEKARVTIANRTLTKAKQLAKQYGCHAAPISELNRLLAENEILISTLPENFLNLDPQALRPHHIVFDANYKTAGLLKQAKSKGCTTLSGEDWLLNQAAPAYEYFTGEKPPQQICKSLEDAPQREKPKNIALVGFMASGKSTVGRALAQKTGFTFCDTDTQIEQQTQMSIPEIFARKGEKFFRKKEKQILQQVLKNTNQIVSCGGGMILDQENRARLKNNALTIWLFATPQATVQRMASGTRPLLAGNDALQKAERIFSQRLAFYAQSADILFNTEKNTIAEISNFMYEEISKTFPD